ncbi:MAG TPA: hypothetical protein VEP90_25570, partial [Methylomirabilota bacterium]|nr:hypothetical protein [Methylomirabilota bacterium]
MKDYIESAFNARGKTISSSSEKCFLISSLNVFNRPSLYVDNGHYNTVKFGLQHPNFSFDFRNDDASEIVDSLKNLVTRAETLGFDSFWEMDTDNDTNQH